MAGLKISAIGIPWYARQDYRRILEIMTDADKLPRTYDQWLKKAEAVERQIKAGGGVAVRAEIDPKTFPDWCGAEGLDVDAGARGKFAAWKARVQLAGGVN